MKRKTIGRIVNWSNVITSHILRQHLSVNLSASAFQTLPSLSLVLRSLHTASTLAMSLNADAMYIPRCWFEKSISGWLRFPPGIERATDQFQQLWRETGEGVLLLCSHIVNDLGKRLRLLNLHNHASLSHQEAPSFSYFLCFPQFPVPLLCPESWFFQESYSIACPGFP